MPKPTKRAKKRNKLRMQKPESTEETTTTNSSDAADHGVETAPVDTPVAGGSREIPFGAKAKFIRSQPYDMPASVVMERALAAGIKLSENHIYATRQRTRAEGNGKRDRNSTDARGAVSGVREVPRGNPSTKQQLLEQLEAIIFRIGYDDAESVFLRMKREHHI